MAGQRDRRDDAARERLTEAVAELRGRMGSDLRLALKRLPDTDDIREASFVSAGNVRTLLLWSAQHVHLAAELEAAARCCRTIDEELRHQVEELAERLPGHLEPARDSGHDGLPDKPPRRGLAGWLGLTSQRTRTAQEAPRHPSPSAQSPSLAAEPEADAAVLVLGPLELLVAGRRVVRWNNLKARAVFQYLLIHHGRPVRRDTLMDLQWPDHTRTSARNNLNVALHSLRNTLGGPWHGVQPILYRDGCYVLNPHLKWWIDREEFFSAFRLAQMVQLSGNPRQAIGNYERAIQLYRGPLFEDDPSGDWYLAEQRASAGKR
jgi:hypothetical protein